ncbi:nitronate monooxygenase [Cuneatibacter sp. NSJ-177]|uniref:NAD(P)H-dependent flavin oxidoreductase n=1 Tax=Cuneatibacter sp. NSJ-177 TaxID=2931401 RepID=UPI001FD39524|nr:nitronate monooxygenase [Cuneatibacter sp. NSJ-177]MCJ7835310.1 nitronate monooxygenase [Cuneatibacter sp. NSJ-177]
MKTRVTEILEITYPILQGAMAWISDCHLAAAVSNAGGAGIIATGGQTENWIREQIREAKRLTNRPFGVNLGLAIPADDLNAMIRAICEEKPAFVTVGAGNPVPFIETFHASKIKVVGIIPNTRLAKKVEAAGIDLIVVEGTEAGGRIGKLTTMALLENVLPEVKLPVLAAGGIVDGRGMAAAMIMGAEGIQMGTRFLASKECIVHPQYKDEILKAGDEQSVSIGLSRNKGLRGLKSPFTERYTQMENSGVSTEELSLLVAGISEKVAKEGLGADGMNGMVQCGQAVGPVKEILSVKEIIERTAEEAEQLLKNAYRLAAES